MSIQVACKACGRSFSLSELPARRKMRCPECRELAVEPVHKAPDGSDLIPEHPSEQFHPAFRQDMFLFRQKVFSITEKYVVRNAAQEPILYIERPAKFWKRLLAAFSGLAAFGVLIVVAVGVGMMLLERFQMKAIGVIAIVTLIFAAFAAMIFVAVALSPKRHTTVYEDDTKSTVLLRILQDSKWRVIHTTYSVVTPEGEFLARLKKSWIQDIWIKRWSVVDAEGHWLFRAREDSLLLAIIRRWMGPWTGLTNFVLLVPDEVGAEREIGEFNRQFTLFDRYVLDLRRDHAGLIDRRLAVALGVMLDTGEYR